MRLQSNFTWLLLTISFSLLEASLSPKITKNGGVLPYFLNENTGEVYFLVGKEIRPYRISNDENILVSDEFFFWQDFGGDLELPSHATCPFLMLNRCLKEAYEELHVIFPELSQIEQLPPYVQSEQYTVFLVRLPEKISLDLLNSYFLSMEKLTDSFIFNTFRGINRIDIEFNFAEKKEYRWVTLQDIKIMTQNTNTSFLKPLNEQAPLNQLGYRKTNVQTQKEMRIIFAKIKKNTDRLDLLYESFIPFFTGIDSGIIMKDKFLKPSIIELINEGTLQKQPCYQFNKWFTTIYCLLYRKIDIEECELFMDVLSKNRTYFYPILTTFDTTEQFINIFASIEATLSIIKYDTSNIKKFLEDIHFQINTDSQMAYCAFEIKEFSPALEYVKNLQQHTQDHQKYLQSFLQDKQYKAIAVKTIDFHDFENKPENPTKIKEVINPPENKPIELTPNNNQNSHVAWSYKITQLFHKYSYLFGGVSCAGFLFALYWYMK
jgi:hypothetical protein